MKEGRKSAVRLFDQERFAHDALWLAGKHHSVVKRPGQAIRCLHYCIASPVCSFAQGLKEDSNGATPETV